MSTKYPFEDKEEPETKPVSSETTSEMLFIQGGLRAARNSPPSIRETVMNDLSHIMGCSTESLEFLFGSDQDDKSIYDFPDSERRRQVIRDNKLDAAE